MAILSSVPTETLYDVCIVGAGPVGLSLALEAHGHGLRVLILESGSNQNEGDAISAELSHAAIVAPLRHAPMALATRRAFGGSSWLWGGRCVPYESIDFAHRDWVPHSGWPLTLEEMQPWYSRAANYLDCGNADFRSPSPAWPDMGEIEVSQLERWARRPKLAPTLGARVLAVAEARTGAEPISGPAARANTIACIDLLFETTVTGMVFEETGAADPLKIHNLQARHRDKNVVLRARHYVLACGGLENTRLLLSVQRSQPKLFGGPDGPLGRYYMGHIFGGIASVVLTRPQDFADLDFTRDATATYVRRRFTLSAAAQREHKLLNTSFFADNPPFYDQRHRNATLSMVFLGLAIPAIGRRMIAEAIRLKHIGPPPYHYGAHVMNILRRPWRAATDIITILRLRYLSATRKPGFVLHNQGGTYALNYHAEQIPNPDSRVTLNNETDAMGMPRLTIDFRYLAADADSVVAAHDILDRQLRASGKGRLEYQRPPEQRVAHVLEQATDGFHQAGTTRMGDDPRNGVVDRNCKVFGIANLHIASSSVFTTTGEANPTFMAVALAARLAARIANQLATTPASAHLSSARDPAARPAPASTTAVFAAATIHTGAALPDHPPHHKTAMRPIQIVRLPGTDLDVSRLSFGTASLHHLFTQEKRQALLSAAIEAGFTHFDTSPLYGFGLAEQSLGQLRAIDRQNITVASKVGLYGPHGATPHMLDILVRKVAGKAVKGLNRAVVDWSLATARISLENSLRRLRRERLDILYLHEPVQALIVTDEWLQWLESRQQAGQIRYFGIAGEAPLLAAILDASPALAPIVQIRDSLGQQQADLLSRHGRALQFTYGYLADAAQSQTPAALTLQQALQRNPNGSILVSTRRIERVAALAAVGAVGAPAA